MAALAIAELSTTEAFAACMSCLLCRGFFLYGRYVFIQSSTWAYGAYARSRCVGAAALLGGAYDAHTAAAGFAGVTALAIAELSATEAFAACTSCLLCRGLLSCGPAVFAHDNDAWVQRRCPAGRMICAQLPLDLQA